LPISTAFSSPTVNKHPAKFLSEAPTVSDFCSPVLIPYPSGSPEKSPPLGYPNRTPTERDTPLPEPSYYLLKFPVNKTSPGFSVGSHRETPVSRAFFCIFVSNSPFLQSHWKMSLPPCSTTGSLWLCVSSPEPMVYSFIHICQSPQLRSPLMKTGKTFAHRPRSLMQREGLHTVGCSPVPQPDRSQHCCTTQWHAAFSTIPSPFTLVDQIPAIQHVSQLPSSGYPTSRVTASHLTLG
jgi:hypothetical protein